MASVKIEGGKLKGGTAAKAQFRHSAPDSRLKYDHSNKDIDKSKIVTNTSINGLDYAQICSKYDARIQYLDDTTNTNKRKDRLTAVCFILNLPRDIPEDKQDEWFMKATDIMKGIYNAENFLDCYIHRDEVHEYIDPDTKEKKMSEIHGHSYWIPEHDGRLNGKWFTGKENLIRMNNEIEKMTMADYGVHFMTGERSKSRGKTEDLKRRSADEMLKEAARKEELARVTYKGAHEIFSQADALEHAWKALEDVSKADRVKLYDEADKALKTAHSVSEWHPDEEVERILKRRRVKIKQPDSDEMILKSYWDIVQEELAAAAEKKNRQQEQELQHQSAARAQREQRHDDKMKKARPKSGITEQTFREIEERLGMNQSDEEQYIP